MEIAGNKKILIIGASSDLCTELVRAIAGKADKLGLHYNKRLCAVEEYEKLPGCRLFPKNFRNEMNCREVIEEYVEWAGGIDYLVIMIGNCLKPVFWEQLEEADWMEDYKINTVYPFLLAKSAIGHMKRKGGRILFTGTASAQNAGGSNSLTYGAAKLGLECVMKRLAKDCAQYGILVNMVNPGFVMSRFHTEVMKRSSQELKKRAEMVPLKRGGTMQEAAAPYLFLLSEDASFITGEVINVKGGDWI